MRNKNKGPRITNLLQICHASCFKDLLSLIKLETMLEPMLETKCAMRCLVTDDNYCNYYRMDFGTRYCHLARFDYGSGSYSGNANDQTVFQLKKSIDLSSLAESKISETESDSSCAGHGYHVLNNDGDKVSFFLQILHFFASHVKKFILDIYSFLFIRQYQSYYL